MIEIAKAITAPINATVAMIFVRALSFATRSGATGFRDGRLDGENVSAAGDATGDALRAAGAG